MYDTDGLQPAHIITVSTAMEHVAATTLALWHVPAHCVYVHQLGAIMCSIRLCRQQLILLEAMPAPQKQVL